MKRMALLIAWVLCSICLADNLGTWKIDDYVTIPATTHRFSTGAAYQPTSLTYTIYEDDSTSHLVENVDMTPASPFDSVVGLYLAKVQLTAVAGYEAGKHYTVVLKATVDGVSGIATHNFQVQATAPAANVTQINGVATTSVTTINANLGTTQPVNQTGTGVSAVVKGDGITPATIVDGTKTWAQLARTLLSFLVGKMTITDLGATSQYDLYQQNGTTIQYTLTSTDSTGARPTGGTIEP